MKKFLILSLTAFLILQNKTMAQVSAGVYQLSSNTFMAIGTDPENKIFGEARLGVGHDVDIEGTFGYNFIQKDEVNLYSGFHLGADGHHDHDHDHNHLYLGIPLGVLVKPFPSTRNFGFLLEASPIFANHSENYLRAGIGMKYTFR
ncbi:outer membrane insertion C- signal [Echinicola marina]|uniref:outer membrane insertion C- signal n=1 Tax=Echinicola marina TaxID=2859768 RepID=UPI001CF62FA2|nr:outer membrane insertion C- signal [Echinicola marina]UCS94462.1 outer membrane insertion C- signal [Echinicola marina]